VNDYERKAYREALAARQLLQIEVASLKTPELATWAHVALWTMIHQVCSGPTLPGVHERGF
jgi:hypothetical protein